MTTNIINTQIDENFLYIIQKYQVQNEINNVYAPHSPMSAPLNFQTMYLCVNSGLCMRDTYIKTETETQRQRVHINKLGPGVC